MKQLDRYILKQLFGPFVFFMVIFIGLLWLNRALRLVDIVVENGQPASVFVQLAITLLPTATEAAVPIAGFAASVLVTNRLFSEAELVVMMNAGRSVLSLAFPYAVFGCICFAGMMFVTHFWAPIAKQQIYQKQDEISRQYVTQIVKEGEFVTNDGRYTFFFGEKGLDGTLSDIMISERTATGSTITHLAQKGQAVTQGDVTKLLLFNGTIQDFSPDDISLSVIQFGSLSYDLSQFGDDILARETDPDERFTGDLRAYTNSLADPSDDRARHSANFHNRFVKPLLAFLSPLIGMSALLVGGFSRSGFVLRIVLGIVLMFSINSFRGVCISWVTSKGAPWFMAYTPVFLTLIIIAFLLTMGSHDIKSLVLRRFKKRRQVAV